MDVDLSSDWEENCVSSEAHTNSEPGQQFKSLSVWVSVELNTDCEMHLEWVVLSIDDIKPVVLRMKTSREINNEQWSLALIKYFLLQRDNINL